MLYSIVIFVETFGRMCILKQIIRNDTRRELTERG
jgi:hypothetical protein